MMKANAQFGQSHMMLQQEGGRVSIGYPKMGNSYSLDIQDKRSNRIQDKVDSLLKKKFIEADEQEPIKRMTRESKPLPTLRSLAKENKKLQRLLQISLNQRDDRLQSESLTKNAP